MTHSSALPLAKATLRTLIVLNWLVGAAILTLPTATIVAEQWTFTALGISPVFLVFVLARVFAEGTVMREDLCGTV